MPISVDRYEAIAEEVLAIYEDAELTMMRKVARRLNRGIKEPGWTEGKYAEMQDVVKELRDYLAEVSAKRREVQRNGLTDAYLGSRDAFLNDAYRFTNVTGIRGLTANTQKVVQIMAELDQSMNAADRRILRTAQDAYSTIVGRASSVVATGSITYREAVKRELAQFADRGISSFIDKAGRTWDMETYAEMATLTAIERATRTGYTDTMREFGYDLAIISDHYGACPLCEAWQGMVISISGNTPGYHTLADAEAAGVFHPRCLHDISVYHEPAGALPLSFAGPERMALVSGSGGVRAVTQPAQRVLAAAQPQRPTRTEPRSVEGPSEGYEVRSQQRAMERQVRKWKRRMAVSADPEDEREAYARVRLYQGRIRALIDNYNANIDPSIDHLPRKYWREGGRVKLSAAARRLPSIQLTLPGNNANMAQN